MKQLYILMSVLVFVSCNKKIVVERTTNFPKQTELMSGTINKQNVWVFILAGQSNMAGRGIVEPQDTVPNKRILSINKNGQLIMVKKPLHFYEPNLAGLDCGYSFGKAMIKNIPDSISILLLPTAVGGSSISQWLGDSLFRNVKLLSNFIAKVEIGKQYGTIKGILWHQGESDANEKNIPLYSERLSVLFTKFRKAIGNDNLPILLGELGSFSKNKEGFGLINKTIHNYSSQDANTTVISTGDLKHKGDSLHFNSKAQRTMGKRFAAVYLQNFLKIDSNF
jgi:Carbohydrate esterase, sialic acid-specific acetylesterase